MSALVIDGPSIAANYRAWEATGVGGQDPVEARDAAYECDAHGRLPGDRTTPCGCFPDLERQPTPEEVVMYDERTERIEREAQEAQERVQARKATEHAERQAQEHERREAPFGRKADGTPRKRPAPPPHVIEAARAAKAAKRTAVTVHAGPAVAGSDFLAQMVRSFDAEIARLRTEAEQLAAARDLLG